MLLILILILCRNIIVLAYFNKLFTVSKYDSTDLNEDMCAKYLSKSIANKTANHANDKLTSFVDMASPGDDPYEVNQDILYKFLFGDFVSYDENNGSESVLSEDEQLEKTKYLLHAPTGQASRKAGLFYNKSSVHLPMSEMIHQGYCQLKINSEDYMQTAVDAFAILVEGNLNDISRLPPDYVLRSARTISMMTISHEKLAAIWDVVKGDKDTADVTIDTLERYRPLFKYLSGKEMARLNLSDPRTLRYIGTHPGLTRHQVGVVASKYLKTNSRWSEPKYLNLMNNLICGVPMTFMRKISENTFLQLSHQIFYHTRACDPLQRRFYLVMMTRTQALGKSNSWNAQDVSRLGLLLAEVDGRDLAAIKPEALAGLTSQVLVAMRPENLKYLSPQQILYLEEKPLSILTAKLKNYDEENL